MHHLFLFNKKNKKRPVYLYFINDVANKTGLYSRIKKKKLIRGNEKKSSLSVQISESWNVCEVMGYGRQFGGSLERREN